MCSQFKWMGNSKSKKRISDLKNDDKAKEQVLFST